MLGVGPALWGRSHAVRPGRAHSASAGSAGVVRPLSRSAAAGGRRGGSHGRASGDPRRSDSAQPPSKPPTRSLFCTPSPFLHRPLGHFLRPCATTRRVLPRSATDLLPSRSFGPLPRGHSTQRSHKLLGSSVPSLRPAEPSAHSDNDASTSGGRGGSIERPVGDKGHALAGPHGSRPARVLAQTRAVFLSVPAECAPAVRSIGSADDGFAETPSSNRAVGRQRQVLGSTCAQPRGEGNGRQLTFRDGPAHPALRFRREARMRV